MGKIQKIPYKGKELLPAKCDLVFKAMMTADGDLRLLASLLSCVLELNIHADDITVTNTELPPTHAVDKPASVDVRVKLSDGKHINTEIQVEDKHNMEKRSVFYASRLYVEQMVSGMDYIEICPVIAINILNFPFLPYAEYHNRYRLKNLRTHDELTEVFELHFIELPKVSKDSRSHLKDMWMRFLAAETEEELETLANENPVFEKALDKLVYVSADEKLRYELDMREKAELDYWSAMTSNYRKGKEEGREVGAEAEREKWQGVVAEKDAALTEKDALIAELRARLGEGA